MLLIRGARVLTMEEKDLDGDILVNDEGAIEAVGAGLSAPGARVIEARGLYACPGFIDAHTHIGMWEDAMRKEGDDGNEITDPVTPQLRAIDAINPKDRCFDEALAAGVTTVCTGPGSANVLGGQFALLSTRGASLEDRLIDPLIALKSAFGENPKFCYGGKDKTPSTRMAIAAVFRQAFIDAQEYARKMALEDVEKRPARSLKHEALAMLLNREVVLKCHAHRADDIQTAIRLCREFNLRFTLDHCTEGWMMPDDLKTSGAQGVIIGPLFSDRSKVELKNLSYKAPTRLHEAGVMFAMMTDHPVIPQQYLPVTAAIAVREGLPEREGLKCITINPARILGIDSRKGSIAQGKDADIALFDAHPLDVRAHVKAVIAQGEIVAE